MSELDELVEKRTEMKCLLTTLNTAAEELRALGIVEQCSAQQTFSDLEMNIAQLILRLDELNTLLADSRRERCAVAGNFGRKVLDAANDAINSQG